VTPRWWVCCLAAGLVWGLPVGAAVAADQPHLLLRLTDGRIAESSGLAASALHPGVLYTHNDSGDTARFFAVGPSGRVVATYDLPGASARDWEAMAAGPGPLTRHTLWFGDLGDNLGGSWPQVYVFAVREPRRLVSGPVRWTRYRLRYADGPRDAEALLVDPRSGRLYVVSKEAGGAGVYAAPPRLRRQRVNVLHRVADAPPLVTDGAFSPDGSRVALRDYVEAHVYDRPGGSELARVTLPLQQLGESLTWSRDAQELLVGSEGAGSGVWAVPLPDSARAHAAAVDASAPTGPSGSPRADPIAGATQRPRSLLVVGVLVVLAAVVAAARRRRR